MDLIGQPIKHKTFGSGIVTDLSDGIVTICFQNHEKRFIYPDAFHSFLVLKDREAQRHIENQIKDQEAAAQQARQAEQAEQERKNKLLNFRITANSHAVFHVASEQIDQIIRTCQVSTGTYLSGYSRGTPRIADRMKPNSVCLLTTRRAGKNEEERNIIGAFMVREDFFGEDVHDGVIKGHLQHRIFLPEESRLLFWEHLGQNALPRWGNTAFKYCSEDVINKILADMTELLNTSKQKDTAIAFYRYFCKINRLRPLIKLEELEESKGKEK